ncbi:MAG: SoxR reducing system RseC family protein [Bacteroides sp.]|nr:SoxR reducing system RseC family protein [Roseburia sp.]MCM1347085.1 SoxR reducing system RseC family protein [Bacteroides sp.]MCM1421606.1 SoxR reducing system RseC family protein [Bacteroides sp.]
MKGKIEHRGIIESIEGCHVRVKIVQSSACSLCQAKSLCASAESKEKLIDLYASDASSYNIGEEVTVYGSASMGRDAVIFAFVIPLVLIIAWLAVAIEILHINDAAAVGVVFALLAAYYIILWMGKERFSKKFLFMMEKI